MNIKKVLLVVLILIAAVFFCSTVYYRQQTVQVTKELDKIRMQKSSFDEEARVKEIRKNVEAQVNADLVSIEAVKTRYELLKKENQRLKESIANK